MSDVVIELQQDALNESKPVSSLLRKAIVVATKLQLNSFEQWANQELKGYDDSQNVPDYRKIVPQLMGRNPYYGWQRVILDQTTAKLMSGPISITQSVSILEDWIQPKVGAASIYLPLNSSLQKTLMGITQANYEFGLHIQPSALVGVLNDVRNSVLSWSLDLERRGITGQGLTFTSKDREVAASVTHIINYHGNVAQSQIMNHSPGASQSIATRQLDRDSLTRVVSEIKAIADKLELSETDGAELNAEITTVEAQLTSPTPKSKILSESLATIKRILEGAAGGAVGNILTELARIHVF